MTRTQAHPEQPYPSGGRTIFIRWCDSWAGNDPTDGPQPLRIDWLRLAPLVFMYIMCVGALWVGWSWTAIAVAAALSIVRMFAITAFYHRPCALLRLLAWTGLVWDLKPLPPHIRDAQRIDLAKAA